MKNKRTFFASVALAIFLFAMAAPTISGTEDLGIDRKHMTRRV